MVNIKELRKRKGWSQQRLAELSGVSTRTIQRIENGYVPAISTTIQIAQAFQIEVEDIVWDTPTVNKFSELHEAQSKQFGSFRMTKSLASVILLVAIAISGLFVIQMKNIESLAAQVSSVLKMLDNTSSELTSVFEDQTKIRQRIEGLESQNLQKPDDIEAQSLGLNVVRSQIDSFIEEQPTPALNSQDNQSAEYLMEERDQGLTEEEVPESQIASFFNIDGAIAQMEDLSEENFSIFADMVAEEIAAKEQQSQRPSNTIDQYLDYLEALMNARDRVVEQMEGSQFSVIAEYVGSTFQEFDVRIPEDLRSAIDPNLAERAVQYDQIKTLPSDYRENRATKRRKDSA